MSQWLRYAAVVAVLALSTPFAAPAHAQGGVQVGTLTCNASGAWGFVFGSTRDLACTFAGPGGVQRYSGQISQFGVNLGFTEGGVLIWTVIAPTAQLRPGDLAGSYGGPTGRSTGGGGGGGNALIGGEKKTTSPG